MLAAVPVAVAGPPEASPQAIDVSEGQRAFDFEFGRWRTTVKRLRQPLAGNAEWVEYEGTSIVHPLLGGRANLVELAIAGPAGRIEGVSLRLYHPESRQWTLHYASAADGELGMPLTGRLENGRGEFYGDDRYRGRAIRVRFVISRLSEDSVSFEQAFSADGGTTWEVNWIATDVRL